MKTINLHDMQSVARSYRRTGATAITHSGGKQTIFGCLCGSRHTTSTDWYGRSAKHVQDWQEQHETSCGELYAQMIARRDNDWLVAQRDAIYSSDY